MSHHTAISNLSLLSVMTFCAPCVMATAPTASVCAGYNYSTILAIDQSADKLTTEAKFTVGGTNPCSFYSEVTLSSPSGRTQSGVSASPKDFNAGTAYSSTIMTVAYDTGTYSATGRWAAEDDVSGLPWTYYPSESGLASKSMTKTINGFVQLTSVGWSATSIPRVGGASFWAYLISSTGCAGTVTVTGTLGAAPSGATWTWGSVNNPSVVTTGSTTISSPGVQGTVQFPLTISSPNTGTVSASATVLTVPSGCESRGPTGSSSSTLTLTN
jgi:hypothetical protein